MNKLILFDIDKTLIKNSKAHDRAFSEAFKRVYGIDANIDILYHHGMTDQQVIIEALRMSGLNEKDIKSKLEECARVMVDSFNKVVGNDEIILLGGVKELLEELNGEGALMGLVTGNLESIQKSS